MGAVFVVNTIQHQMILATFKIIKIQSGRILA